MDPLGKTFRKGCSYLAEQEQDGKTPTLLSNLLLVLPLAKLNQKPAGKGSQVIQNMRASLSGLRESGSQHDFVGNFFSVLSVFSYLRSQTEVPSGVTCREAPDRVKQGS